MTILYGIDARAFEFWCQLDARSQSLSAVLGFLSIPTNGSSSTSFNNLLPDDHVDQSLGQLLHLPDVELLLRHQLVDHLEGEPGKGPQAKSEVHHSFTVVVKVWPGERMLKIMDIKRKLAL